ncbi:MAG: hypothetical protein QOE70_68 [Chthoniobacter sp.]|nr:hypothetical protein [Chthoniobacter sp.]
MIREVTIRLMQFSVLRFVIFVAAILAAVAWPRALGAARGSPVKVAIIAPGTPELEALLIDKLSRDVGLAMLSRADLLEIARELQTGAAAAALRIVGADRLLFIEPGEAPAQNVSARVTDSATGAVIHYAQPPSTLDAAKTAEWLALRLPPFLRVPEARETRRISLLGFRFDLDSPAHRAFERRLNLAFAAALQGRALVLERWRLQDLVFENSLREVGDQGFWKGAELVDGSIQERGGQVEVHVRVRKADASEPVGLVVHGSLAEVGELAQRIMESLLSVAQPVGQDSDREVKAFQAEAAWLIDHGLPLEAAQAAESAIALGLAGGAAEMLRIKAYAMCAYPDDLRATHGQDGGYRSGAISAERIGFSVSMATEMSLLTREYLSRHAGKRFARWTLEDAETLGVHTLYTGLRVLRAAHTANFHQQDQAAVENLRRTLVEQIEQLGTMPLRNLRSTYFTYLTNYAGYWNATPEATLTWYRRVLDRKFDGDLETWPAVIRSELAYSDDLHAPLLAGRMADAGKSFIQIGASRLVAWDSLTEERLRPLWEGYVNELLSSPDALQVADGLSFRWRSLPGNAERFGMLPAIVDFVTQNLEAFRGPDAEAMIELLTQPLRGTNRTPALQGVHAQLLECYLRLLDSAEPLPPAILGRIWILFTDNNSGAKLRPDAIKLRAALAAHRSRVSGPSAREEYLRQITTAEASIDREFPDLTVREIVNPLVVSKLWVMAAHTLEALTGKIGFDGDSGLWHGGRLWFVDPFHGKLWKIDPATFATEIIAAENAPETHFGIRPAFAEKHLFLSAHDGVSMLDPTASRWTALSLPAARYRVFAANGSVWAAFGERPRTGADLPNHGTGLYRIDPQSGESQLIFSTRRRPAEHPLDSQEVAEPFTLFAGTDGQPVIGLLGEWWSFHRVSDGGVWKGIVPSSVQAAMTTESGTLLLETIERAGDMKRLKGAAFISPQGHPELLLRDDSLARPPAGDPVWNLPDAIRAPLDAGGRNYCAALLGEAFFLLAWDTTGSPWGASKADLYVFRRGRRDATQIPLQFQVLPADEPQIRKVAEARVFRFPYPDNYGLVATDRGLAITGRGMWGFWFIPQTDLERALAARETPEPAKSPTAP